MIVKNLRLTQSKLDVCVLVPVTIGHPPLNDTTFRGYNIPKTAEVHANLYGIHMNPDTFPEPTKFKPSRFLDDNDKLVKTDLVIPFGVGKLLPIDGSQQFYSTITQSKQKCIRSVLL